VLNFLMTISRPFLARFPPKLCMDPVSSRTMTYSGGVSDSGSASVVASAVVGLVVVVGALEVLVGSSEVPMSTVVGAILVVGLVVGLEVAA